MKNYIFLIFILILPALVSCSKTGDDPKPNKGITDNDIIGTWKVHYYELIIKAETIEDGVKNEVENIFEGINIEKGGYQITFNENHTVTTKQPDSYQLKLTFIVNGEKEELIIDSEEEDGFTVTFENFTKWNLKDMILNLEDFENPGESYPFNILKVDDKTLDIETPPMPISSDESDEEGTIQLKFGMRK